MRQALYHLACCILQQGCLMLMFYLLKEPVPVLQVWSLYDIHGLSKHAWYA